MALNFFDFRPPDIPQEVWERWLVELLTNSSFDPYEFYSWYCPRVTAQVLEKLLLEEVEGKIPRRLQRFRKRSGILPTDKKPLVAESIGMFGGLHYGTPYGFHRQKMKAPRGTKYSGVAGSVIIMLMLGIELSDPTSIGDFTVDGVRFPSGGTGWAQHDIKATAFALVNEAKKRGDRVTLFIGPRCWDADWDERYSGRRYGLKNNVWWGRETPFKYYDRAGEVVWDMAENEPADGWINGVPDLTAIGRNGQVIQAHGNHGYDAQVRELGSGGYWNHSGRGGRQTHRHAWSEMAPPPFFNSQEYDQITDFICRIPPNSHYSTLSESSQQLAILRSVFDTMPKMKRGKVIIVGAFEASAPMTVGWRMMRDLNKHADIYMFDMGRTNHDEHFFGGKDHVNTNITPCQIINGQETEVPLFMVGSERIMNYYHIPDATRLTEVVLRATR